MENVNPLCIAGGQSSARAPGRHGTGRRPRGHAGIILMMAVGLVLMSWAVLATAAPARRSAPHADDREAKRWELAETLGERGDSAWHAGAGPSVRYDVAFLIEPELAREELGVGDMADVRKDGVDRQHLVRRRLGIVQPHGFDLVLADDLGHDRVPDQRQLGMVARPRWPVER